jgi:hypothetical protein
VRHVGNRCPVAAWKQSWMLGKQRDSQQCKSGTGCLKLVHLAQPTLPLMPQGSIRVALNCFCALELYTRPGQAWALTAQGAVSRP